MRERTRYDCVIGLEVHAQLDTKSKLFCGCSTAYGSVPNTQVCPVCLGLPGVLPVLNRRAVEYAMKTVLACNGKVNNRSLFARKNYFYPDLPKGYQISQYDMPVGTGGEVEFDLRGSTRRIGLMRIHLEEDAGKLLHIRQESAENISLVDLNRCGMPLVEIVSRPTIHSPEVAYAYLIRLKQILQYLEVCSGDMEKGALRCDANVSVRRKGSGKVGVRTELKNLNSFRGVERALRFEIDRQVNVLESGAVVEQETRLWDEDRNVTVSMRSKEESHDYRYFTEPDLIDLIIDDDWVAKAATSLRELPHEAYRRFVEEFSLPPYDAEVLTMSRELANYVSETVAVFPDAKKAANWIMTEVLGVLAEKKIDISEFTVSPPKLGGLLSCVEQGVISGRIAKEVFREMVETGESAETIVVRLGIRQITDKKTIDTLVSEVLAANKESVAAYREGRRQIFGYLIGEIMKATNGRADPQITNKLLRRRLDES